MTCTFAALLPAILSMMSLQIRTALDADQPAIINVVNAAFGEAEGPEITQLIMDLLNDPTAQPLLSLVATLNDQAVGHILFTKTQIKPTPRPVNAAILAPLAVHPDYQKQGIGGQLIQAGRKQLQAQGVELVFVLGYPSYYSRHGFTPAGNQGFNTPYAIPPEAAEAWMVQELQPGVIDTIQGTVLCANALSDPKYWRE
ncbi:MAG: N-acetyltransferase [Cyanobacteria bacterium P01_G01_bin.54]